MPADAISWDRNEAEREAKAMFGNQALHRPAAALAGAHRYALDYIKQAPVIVLAANAGRTGPIAAQRARAFAGPPMRYLAEKGAELREVMTFYGCGYQLRKLAPSVLHPIRWSVIFHLGRLPPSTLSQVIPAERGQQDVWLRALTRWTDHCERRCGNPWLLFDWAAVALRQVKRREEDMVTNIADLAMEAGKTEPLVDARFDQRWTFQQATAAAERWHRALGRLLSERDTAGKLGVVFSAQVEYAPFPNEPTVVAGYEFVPLRSCEDLWVEGAAMHHCVASYSAAVIGGRSRIFSIQREGRRVATLELARLELTDKHPLHQIVQLKGPCNSNPIKAVFSAAEQFVAETRERIKNTRGLRAAFPDIMATFSDETSRV